MFFRKLGKRPEKLRPETLEELLAARDELINLLARVIDAKDVYTSGHTERVIQYALATGKALGLSEHQMHDLRMTSLLHDIGKIGIPDHILRKPTSLTTEEWAEVRKHPVKGESILQRSASLEEVRRAVRCHQERYDGKGFPDGLKGEAIPLYARIVAVADAYDAMTSDRCYRKALSKRDALREIESCARTQFDPEIVKAFLKLTGYRQPPLGETSGAPTLLAQISIRTYEAAVRRMQETNPGAGDEDLAEELRRSFPMLDFRGAWKIVDGVGHPERLTDDLDSANVMKVKEDEYKLILPHRIEFTVGEVVTFRNKNYNLINVMELPGGGYEYHLKH